MENKLSDQILQTRNIPAKPISSSQHTADESSTKKNKISGMSDADQQIAAETQVGENAGVTTAQEEHHHHHHHHHHRHSLFHSSIRNLSDLWDFIKRLCQKAYTLAYVIVFVMFLLSILIASPKCLVLVRAFRSMMSPEQFYRFQEYVFIHQAQLMSLPMQIALVAIIIILLYIRTAHPSKFNTYFMRILPALLVAIFLSLPIFHVTGVQEDRINCRGNLDAYYKLLKDYAAEHDGMLPESLQKLEIPKSSILSFCDPDHYEFHAAGKQLNTLASEKLLEDNPGQHAGNYRMMLMSDGTYYESLYDGSYKKIGDNFVEIANDAIPQSTGKKSKVGKYE